MSMQKEKTVHNYIYQLLFYCQILEETKLSFNEWRDKHTVVHPYNEITFSDKKEMSYQVMRRQKNILNVDFKKAKLWRE